MRALRRLWSRAGLVPILAPGDYPGGLSDEPDPRDLMPANDKNGRLFHC